MLKIWLFPGVLYSVTVIGLNYSLHSDHNQSLRNWWPLWLFQTYQMPKPDAHDRKPWIVKRYFVTVASVCFVFIQSYVTGNTPDWYLMCWCPRGSYITVTGSCWHHFWGRSLPLYALRSENSALHSIPLMAKIRLISVSKFLNGRWTTSLMFSDNFFVQ